MHSFALTQIQDITNQAMRQSGTARPQTFLRLFGPIHDIWTLHQLLQRTWSLLQMRKENLRKVFATCC